MSEGIKGSRPEDFMWMKGADFDFLQGLSDSMKSEKPAGAEAVEIGTKINELVDSLNLNRDLDHVLRAVLERAVNVDTDSFYREAEIVVKTGYIRNEKINEQVVKALSIFIDLVDQGLWPVEEEE